MRHARSAACVVLLLATSGSAFGQASFQGIGVLPGENRSQAKDVSADGSVVAAAQSFPSHSVMRWTSLEGLEQLGPLIVDPLYSAREPAAFGVSGNGSTIVGEVTVDSDEGYQVHAFQWTLEDGMRPVLDPFSFGGEFRASATNDDASVIVGYTQVTLMSTTYPRRAMRWTPQNGVEEIVDPTGATSRANDVSADGEMIVGEYYSDIGTSDPFYWTETTGPVQYLDSLLGAFGAATAEAVSADGQYIVGLTRYTGVSDGPYRWSEAGGYERLSGVPGLEFGGGWAPQAVNGDGSVIVGIHANQRDDVYYVVVWTERDGARLLRHVLGSDFGIDISDWDRLLSARGISHDGTVIVGHGRNSTYASEGYVATVPGFCRGNIADSFGNLIPDSTVDFGDFLALLGLAGPCGAGTTNVPCRGDIADDFGTLFPDGMVSFGDFLAMLGNVGPCD